MLTRIRTANADRGLIVRAFRQRVHWLGTAVETQGEPAVVSAGSRNRCEDVGVSLPGCGELVGARRLSPRAALGALAAGVLALSLVAADSAAASFPGLNGKILYSH